MGQVGKSVVSPTVVYFLRGALDYNMGEYRRRVKSPEKGECLVDPPLPVATSDHEEVWVVKASGGLLYYQALGREGEPLRSTTPRQLITWKQHQAWKKKQAAAQTQEAEELQELATPPTPGAPELPALAD